MDYPAMLCIGGSLDGQLHTPTHHTFQASVPVRDHRGFNETLGYRYEYYEVRAHQNGFCLAVLTCLSNHEVFQRLIDHYRPPSPDKRPSPEIDSLQKRIQQLEAELARSQDRLDAVKAVINTQLAKIARK